MSTRSIVPLLLGLWLASLGPAGAADPSPPAPPDSVTPTQPRAERLSHRVDRTTPWFVNPALAAPPNGFLQAGTRVQLLSTHGSYARVWTEDGAVFAGYVETAALRPLEKATRAGRR